MIVSLFSVIRHSTSAIRRVNREAKSARLELNLGRPVKARSVPSSIEIRLLGSFRVSIDGQPLPESRWRQRKSTLLLQRLALEPHHRLHSEQLMEMLWPEADAEASRNSLHKTIHMTRSALEPSLRRAADSHFLLTRGQQLILSAPARIWIDAEEFQTKAVAALKSREAAAIEEAVAVYEGPLLPEEPYESWVIDRREELRNTYQQLLSALARVHEASGDRERAIGTLNRLVSEDAANEAAHRELMRLQAMAGRPQAALRQYRECADALRRELETEPEPATVTLYEKIVAGQVQAESAPVVRVAVMPFENTTGNPDLDYLSDGLTETVIAGLSRLPRLSVMAHSSVSRYRGEDPRRVAQMFNAGAVMTGRIAKARERVVIRVELIDGADGSRRWGGEFAPDDDIAAAAGEQLGAGTPRKVHRADPEAHQLYLRGRHLWSKRTLETVTRSVDYFRQAIEIDPDFALAWIGLADSYTKLGDVGVATSPPKEAFSKAKIAAVRAVEIDSSLPEAHTSLAHLYMHEYEWAEAEREFRTSLRLQPHNATTREWFAYERLMRGKRDECFEEIRLAIEIDPLSLPVNADYGELLYYARDYSAAIEQYERARELDPHFYPVHLGMGRVYVEMGQYEKSLAALERARQTSGGSVDTFAAIARAHASFGKKKLARDVLAQLESDARTRYVSPYGIAAVYAALGDRDTAFDWLIRACHEHAAWSIYVRVDPRLDPLRDDERFEGVLKSVGLGH